MPFGNRHSAGTIWLPTGNPDTTNISPTDFNSMGGQPGGLGLKHETINPARTYQRVQLDSGVTAATPTGVSAANQLAFWKDRSVYLVTNDRRFAEYGSATQAYQNCVAGVIRLAATAGNYIDILKRGRAIPLLDGGNSFAAGEMITAENDSAAAADRVAVGSAPGFQVLGYARGAASGGTVNVDLDIVGVDDQ